jgi:hypothetical protein
LAAPLSAEDSPEDEELELLELLEPPAETSLPSVEDAPESETVLLTSCFLIQLVPFQLLPDGHDKHCPLYMKNPSAHLTLTCTSLSLLSSEAEDEPEASPPAAALAAAPPLRPLSKNPRAARRAPKANSPSSRANHHGQPQHSGQRELHLWQQFKLWAISRMGFLLCSKVASGAGGSGVLTVVVTVVTGGGVSTVVTTSFVVSTNVCGAGVTREYVTG